MTIKDILKYDDVTKIGWNFGKCASSTQGGYTMLNDPIFIFGTGQGQNVTDYITWKNYGCNKSVTGQINVRGDVYITKLEFTIGPYGSYSPLGKVYFDFLNFSLDPNAVITAHYYTHLSNKYVTLPVATTDPVDGHVIPSVTRVQISDK